MSEQKYVVLQTEDIIVPVAAEVGWGHRSLGENPASLKVEEASLSGNERNDLRRDPRTKAIAPLMPMKLIEPVKQSEVATTSGSATWGIEAVGANASSFDGSDITVAVLDTGIEPNHPAFSGIDLVQRNFTTEGDNDQNGHGTHCAGTIFGQDLNGLRIGVARNIKRALIGKVLGEGGSTSLILAQAIQWAVSEGAHIISMSLGIDFPGVVDQLVKQGVPVAPATSLALEAYRANINLFTELASFVQAQGVFGQGTIIVAASGNESNRPNYEIAVAPPAAGTGVIAVGALQQGAAGLSIANFSNDQVNIAAPGVDVVSAWIGGGLHSLNGTSMATPHVAGVAALWAQKQLQERRTVDSQILMSRLIASGTLASLATGGQPEDVGTGIVQAP